MKTTPTPVTLSRISRDSQRLFGIVLWTHRLQGWLVQRSPTSLLKHLTVKKTRCLHPIFWRICISHPPFLPLKASTTVFLSLWACKCWAIHGNSRLSNLKLLWRALTHTQPQNTTIFFHLVLPPPLSTPLIHLQPQFPPCWSCAAFLAWRQALPYLAFSPQKQA